MEKFMKTALSEAALAAAEGEVPVGAVIVKDGEILARAHHLTETLKESKLYKTACRTMQLLHDFTGFDEGFMPVTPLDDRITRRIRQQIYNHLKI